MTCSYICREQIVYRKRWLSVKKDDRPPHQKRLFIASKGVGLSLDIWPSRKALKRLLQNIYLMLDVLYYKHTLLITTVVDGSIFKEIFKAITWEKKVRRWYYFYPGITMMKL